jgi:hypothetical protein
MGSSIGLEEQKRYQELLSAFLGRPRGRRVLSSARRRTTRSLHEASPKGRSTVHTAAEGRQFRFRLRRVDVSDRSGATPHGPRGEQLLFLAAPLPPPMQAPPTPVLRAADQIRAQGVAFHVATDRVEVVVILHGKRLEATLVHVATTSAVTVSVSQPVNRDSSPS